MKKIILLFAILIGSHSFVWANPIVQIPITKFSELVFDNNNNWTMEIYFPFGYGAGTNSFDSVIFSVSNISSKLKVSYPPNTNIGVITSDSLTTPLHINRDGDKIIIYTYLYGQVEVDSLIFGNYAGATVGKPISGYSIMRYYTRLQSNNYLTIDCLTKIPSLGVVNDTVGLSGTLKGHIYDRNNKPITNCIYTMAGQGIFLLESRIQFNPDGTFTTPIFNTIYKPGILYVKIVDFEGFGDTMAIEPFELNDIHPDTVVVQDIHLMDSCSCCTIVDAIKKYNPPQSDVLTLINYPNPFNLSTNFYIKIPNSINGKQGNINIYNVNGQLLRTIPVSGSSTISWDSKDMNGRIIPSGIYYYRLVIDSQTMKNGSMILLK